MSENLYRYFSSKAFFPSKALEEWKEKIPKLSEKEFEETFCGRFERENEIETKTYKNKLCEDGHCDCLSHRILNRAKK